MQKAVLALSLVLLGLLAPAARADFDSAERAYEQNDYPTAQQEFMRLAKEGDARAQFKIGLMYDDGDVMPQNPEEAMRWYQLAAGNGNIDAQKLLAFFYYTGTHNVTRDEAESARWYLRAAQAGDAEAQYALSLDHAIGTGVEKNKAESIRWRLLAAKQGYVKAQAALGADYHGKLDDKSAAYWFLLAAKQGDSGAQYMLGLLYKRGQGVEQNDNESRRWLLLSAAQGHPSAIEELKNK